MMFSDRIARLRKDRGLNQAQLAKKLGVSVDSVRRWEQGKRSPDVEMLRKIAQVLDTTVSYISGETDNPSSMHTVSSTGVDNSLTGSLQDASFMERLLRSNSMVVYEDGKDRLFIPATPEGFDFFERIKTGKNLLRPAMVTQSAVMA